MNIHEHTNSGDIRASAQNRPPDAFDFPGKRSRARSRTHGRVVSGVWRGD